MILQTSYPLRQALPFRPLPKFVAPFAMALALISTEVVSRAVDLYWDTNQGTTNTGSTATGNWNGTTANFNTDSTGGAGGTTQATTTNADIIHFSSGTNLTGNFTVTVSGTQAASSLLFEEGGVTLSGATIDLTGGSGAMDVASGLTATISSNFVDPTLTKTGTGILALGGSNSFAGGISISAGTVRNGAANSFGLAGGAPITLGAAGNADAAISAANVTTSGTITLFGSGNTGTLRIFGNGSSGQAPTFSGPVNLNGHDLTIGNGASTTSGMNLTGQITGSNTITFDNSNTAVTVVSKFGNAGNASTFTGNVVVASGTIQLEASFAAANTFSVASGARMNLNVSGITIGGLINVSGSGGGVANVSSNRTLTLSGTGDYSFGGVLQNGASGTFGLTMNGSGTQTLTGTSTYTGATLVSAGKLIVSGSLGATATTVSAAGTLGGGGGIGSTLSVTGTAAPGLGSGTAKTLSIGNNVTFNNGSTFVVNLDNNGNASDKLAITGNLSLLGTDTLTFNLLNSTPNGNSFTLATFTGTGPDGINNLFTTDGTLPSGYQILYNANSIVLAAVPEPGTWAMMLGGVGMLSFYRRLRRRKI